MCMPIILAYIILISRVNTYRISISRLMYNYNYNRASIPCQICKQTHLSTQICKILCVYCHEIHKKEEMVENICPKMLKFARQIRPSQQVACKECLGEGTYQKLVVTTYLQTKGNFQKRLKQFNNLPENEEKDEPDRRVIKKQQVSTVQTCTNCEGRGTLKKVQNCCIKGCPSCNYQRCYINPKWKSSKIETLDKRQQKTVCSFCHRLIQVGGRFILNNCKHIYHQQCYIQNNWECRCYDVQVKQLLDFANLKLAFNCLEEQKSVLSEIQCSLGASDDQDYQHQLQLYNKIFNNQKTV